MIGLAGYSEGLATVLSIGGSSANVDVTVVNAIAALPTLSSGELAPYYVVPRAVPSLQFNLGDASVNSKVGPFISNMAYSVFKRCGATHFAVSTTGASFNDFCVTPLDDFEGGADHGGFQLGGDSVGTNTLTTTGTEELAIPVLASGRRARYVLINGHNQSYVQPGFTGETIHGPPPTGMRISSNSGYVLNVSGYTHILATSGSGSNRFLTAAPLEI